MVYTRGTKGDYDNWAKVTGNDKWKYENVLKTFKRAERNDTFSDEYHGTEGELNVTSKENY